jgi:hypothetical protein
MSKEELRRIIESGTQRYSQGQEIKRYAAYPAPEKKHPQRKIPNLKAEAYRDLINGLMAGR